MAVGHLFIEFASLEGTLASLLRLHMTQNLDPDLSEITRVRLAGAVYGSMRLKASRDALVRIAQAEGFKKKEQEFLQGVFAHIAHIEKLRDILAHQTILNLYEKSGKWRVSDITTTKALAQAKFYEFSTDSIILACLDIEAASHRLGVSFVEHKQLFTPEHLDTSPIAWRYKQNMLKPVPPSRHQAPQ